MDDTLNRKEHKKKAMNFFLPSTTSNVKASQAATGFRVNLVDFLYPASSTGNAGSLTPS